MHRRTPLVATLLTVVLAVVGFAAPAQADPPAVTKVVVARPTIYPLVATPQHPAQTLISLESSDPSTIHRIEIRNGADAVVRVLDVPGLTEVTWNGRNDAGTLAPVGTYHVAVFSITDERADATASITVSGLRLIRKTFTRTVSAAGSLAARFVGRCSTLRKPSKRGWRGSLGFYANTKCKKQTWNASAVSTAHLIRLPVAERYLDMRVNTYGGPAKRYAGSRAVIRYFRTTGDAIETFFGGKVGLHRGPQRSTKDMVDSRRYLAWGFATAYKSRYDVKSFTVVVHYDVVG